MPICHKNKFIFFHIPRCAGTSFEVHFRLTTQKQLHGVIIHQNQVIALQHLTPSDLKISGLVEQSILDSYFKFTIIRDPFERMASDYLWQQNHDIHNEFKHRDFHSYLKFAEHVVDEGLYFEKNHFDHFRPMTMYCVEDNQLLVDDILLLDKINDEIERLSDKFGDFKLPHINQSPSYEHLRTRSNIDKVYKLYSADKTLYDNIAALNSA